MDDIETSIIDWLRTFSLPNEDLVKSLGDLSDGYVLSYVLNQIAPDYFEVFNVSEAEKNDSSIATINITKILTLLDGYYRYMLKKYIDISYISPSNVASKDTDDILNLVEIIIGAAFMCNDPDVRAEFVNNILNLDVNSQDYIKSLIESVMSRSKDIEDDSESRDDISGRKTPSSRELELEETLLRSEEAVRHLREENQRLISHISDLEINNSNLKSENSKLKIEVDDLESERRGIGSSDTKSAAVMNLQIELDETKRELDIKLVELDNCKSENTLFNRRLEQANEMIARLSMESRQNSDELDIARDKLKKLSKLESQIEKYQNKLEEMNDLKKQNKELSSKVDQYLDQINQLESSTRSIPTLQRMVEQYKDKAIELERQKFEADSALQMKEHDVVQLQNEVTKLSKQRNELEDEIGALNIELSQFQDATTNQLRSDRDNSAVTLGDDMNGESITSLKEKVKKYEYELANLRATMRGPGDSIDAHNADITILQSEIEDLRRIKKEREDTILQLRKQLVEGQNELTKTNRALADAASSSASTTQLRDSEHKLAQSTNTIKLLEEKLKEKETTINKLEQEKSKLEFYARRTLQTFKDKYITSLQARNTEKRLLEEKIWALTEKLEGNQETTRREERLLLSAMYELGMKIMERNIASQLNNPDNQSAQMSLLGKQRSNQAREILELENQLSSSYNKTPSTSSTSTPTLKSAHSFVFSSQSSQQSLGQLVAGFKSFTSPTKK